MWTLYKGESIRGTQRLSPASQSQQSMGLCMPNLRSQGPEESDRDPSASDGFLTKEASTAGAVTGFLHHESARKSKSYEEEEIDKGPVINPKTP